MLSPDPPRPGSRQHTALGRWLRTTSSKNILTLTPKDLLRELCGPQLILNSIGGVGFQQHFNEKQNHKFCTGAAMEIEERALMKTVMHLTPHDLSPITPTVFLSNNLFTRIMSCLNSMFWEHWFLNSIKEFSWKLCFVENTCLKNVTDFIYLRTSSTFTVPIYIVNIW